MISVLFDLIHLEYYLPFNYFIHKLFLNCIVIMLGHKHQNKQSDHYHVFVLASRDMCVTCLIQVITN